MRRSHIVAAVLVMLAAAAIAPAYAQQTTGNIVGRVLDEQKAAVPGATVTATNAATGLKRTVVSDPEGLYRFTALPVGTYNLTLELTGFASIDRKGVSVTVGQTFTIDFAIRCLVANIYGPNVAGLKDGSQKFAGNAQFKEGVAALKLMIDKGYFEKEGFSRPYFMDGINAFAAGNGAMFVGLLSDVGNWKVFSDKLGMNNVGYFPTINFSDYKYKDQQVAQGAGIGFGVMTWSKIQKTAIDWVKFVSTGEGAKTYATTTGALSPNMAVTGIEASYPALKVVQGYLKNFADDYIPMFYNGYEDEANRLCDQYFVTNEINVDQFIAAYQKLIEKK